MLLYAHCLIVSHPNSAISSNLVTSMSNTVIVKQTSVSMQKKKEDSSQNETKQPSAQAVFPNFSSSRPVSLIPCSATKYKVMSIQ